MAVDFEDHPDGFTYGEMLQPEPLFGETHKAQDMARLLNIAVSDLLADAPIVNVSTGRPNLLVMFKELATIQTLQPDWRQIREYFAAGDKQRGFYFLTPEVASSTARFHARKLTPRGEDPATGSAAGCAAAYFVRQGWVKAGERISLEQGAEMGRPSELFVSAEKRGDTIRQVRVGGYAVRSLRGELELA